MKAVRNSDKSALLKALSDGANPAFRRGEAARKLASQDDDDLFDLIVEQSGPTQSWDANAQRMLVEHAARRNNFPIAQAALAAPTPPDLSHPHFYGISEALGQGHYAMAEWLFSKLPRPLPEAQVTRILEISAQIGHLGWFCRVWRHLNQASHCGPRLLDTAIRHGQFRVVHFLLAEERVCPTVDHLILALEGNHRALVMWLKDRVDWTKEADNLWDVGYQYTPDRDLLGYFLPTCPWRRDFLKNAIILGNLDQATLLWDQGYRSSQPITDVFLSAVVRRGDPLLLEQTMACAAGVDASAAWEWMTTLVEGLFKGKPMRQALVKHIDLLPVIEMVAFWASNALPNRTRRDPWRPRLRWLLSHLDLQRDNGRVLQTLAYLDLPWAISAVLSHSPVENVYQALFHRKVSVELQEILPGWDADGGPVWHAMDTLACQVDAQQRHQWLSLHGAYLPKALAQARRETLAQRSETFSTQRRRRA